MITQRVKMGRQPSTKRQYLPAPSGSGIPFGSMSATAQNALFVDSVPLTTSSTAYPPLRMAFRFIYSSSLRRHITAHHRSPSTTENDQKTDLEEGIDGATSNLKEWRSATKLNTWASVFESIFPGDLSTPSPSMCHS